MTLPLPQIPRTMPDAAPNVFSAALGDEESEAAILGGLMSSGEPNKPNAAFALLSDLTPKSFINVKHQYIWRAMQILAQNNQPIDFVTVSNQLRLVSTEKQNFYEMVGETYLMQLIAAQGESLMAYKKILEFAEWRRAVFQVGAQLQKIAVNGALHVPKAMDQVTEMLIGLQMRCMELLDGKPTNLRDEIEGITEMLLEGTSTVESAGWRTGFREFDRIFRGFQKRRLYLIGGMPGSGKSTLSMNFSRSFLQQDARVLTLSLEMMLDETIMRIIAMQAGVETYKILEKKMDEFEAERLNQSLMYLATRQNANQFHLKYEVRPTIAKMQALVRQVATTSGLDALFVDYAGWELFAPNNPNARVDPGLHFANIMVALKDLAKELNIPVITPVQMKAAYVQRGGKPLITDIEWSTTAGKQADGIILLEEETPYSASMGHGCTIAHIVKNRGGQKDIAVKLESRPHLFTFGDWRS